MGVSVGGVDGGGCRGEGVVVLEREGGLLNGRRGRRGVLNGLSEGRWIARANGYDAYVLHWCACCVV